MKKQGRGGGGLVGSRAAAAASHVQTRVVPSAAGCRHSMAGAGMAGFPLRLLKVAGDNRTAKMCLQVGARRELGILS